MNSSTSISETRWRKWLRLYVLWTLGIGAVFIVFVIALDPYDTGRFAVFASHGMPRVGQRLADASLGRQPQFDIAIIGNSTIQLIDPSHLDPGGHHAVSLAMPGTGPREQLSVVEWFLRHHAGGTAYALVIGIDDRWCETGHAPELLHPFPFWLYGSDADYLANMMQYKSFDSSIRKIRLLSGQIEPMRTDGYNDYDTGHDQDPAGFRRRLEEPGEEDGSAQVSGPPYDFTGVAMLRDAVRQAPRDMIVLLVLPPQFNPDSGSGPAALQQSACAAAFRDLAAQRPHTRLIDFLARPDLTTREDNFWDRRHYRGPVARIMEKDIREALAR